MSRFMSERYAQLEPYVPGEQPLDKTYVKLNTNESPYAVSQTVQNRAAQLLRDVRLYPDPTYRALRESLGERYKVDPDWIMVGNGSDEVLDLAFAAFCDDACPAMYADITYGFYPVFADMNRVPFRIVPLLDDFSMDVAAFSNVTGRAMLVIANPNAPTGIALSRDQIEGILQSNPGNVVLVDEAYVDFGGESCIPLVRSYGNLIVVQTFSKSRSMAGCRLGYAVAQPELINDLNTLRNSRNPYNVNSATVAYGIAALENDWEFQQNCTRICETRSATCKALADKGFTVVPSSTNFVFVRHPRLSGEEVYEELRKRGVLVRHFSKERIADYNRITIGSAEEMDALLQAVTEILTERGIGA